VKLPTDLVDVATAQGLRAGVLERYLAIAKGSGLLKALCTVSPLIRDRVLADPLLGFKLLVEVLLDVGLAAFTEFKRTGGPDDRFSEVEFFATDLLVGSLLNCALVLFIASPVTLAKTPAAAPGLLGALAALPPAILAAAPKGVRYTATQRLAGLARTSALYGAAGFACGMTGQLAANLAAQVRRAIHPAASKAQQKSGRNAPVLTEEMPPIMRTALLWGAFSAGSANVRYQLLAGLDQAVLALPVSQRLIILPAAVTAAARFANNIVGGENFASMARFFGVQ
jgi:Protein RETICULATA-related